MAPLPTIANCFRVALSGGLFAGIRAVNVFHVLTSEDDVSAISAAILASAEQDGMLGGRPESGKPVLMQITPLDGSSATFDVAVPSDSFPTNTGDGQVVPEAAVVVSFKTAQRGPANRGRLYNGPLVESVIANGEVDSVICSGIATAWTDFATALGASSPAIGLAVASYVHADANTVTAITCGTQQATQRRRLLQTR